MLSSLFVFSYPLFQCVKTAATFHPETYSRYEEASGSFYAPSIQAVVERVLNAENEEGAEHQEQVRKMIEASSPLLKERNVENLIETRFRVVSLPGALPSPVYAIRDVSPRGRFFILTHPLIREMDLKALPFLSAHEVGHLLENDALKTQVAKTVVSFAATILTTLVWRWSLLSSLATVLVATVATHALMRHRAEKRADDFAMKHCTSEERKEAIKFFEQVKEQNHKIPGVTGAIFRVLSHLHHPKEETRIANIRASLLQTSTA